MAEGLVALTPEHVVEYLVALREKLANVSDIAIGVDAASPVGQRNISH
jgi:hypothetical protein